MFLPTTAQAAEGQSPYRGRHFAALLFAAQKIHRMSLLP
jgi:hypothetical protein